jgi:hypothetical protein
MISMAAALRRKEAKMAKIAETPAARSSLALLLVQMQALATVIPTLGSQMVPADGATRERDFEAKFDNIPA